MTRRRTRISWITRHFLHEALAPHQELSGEWDASSARWSVRPPGKSLRPYCVYVPR